MQDIKDQFSCALIWIAPLLTFWWPCRREDAVQSRGRLTARRLSRRQQAYRGTVSGLHAAAHHQTSSTPVNISCSRYTYYLQHKWVRNTSRRHMRSYIARLLTRSKITQFSIAHRPLDRRELPSAAAWWRQWWTAGAHRRHVSGHAAADAQCPMTWDWSSAACSSRLKSESSL